MENTLVYVVGILIVFIIILVYLLLKNKNKSSAEPIFDYNNIIQKNTYSMLFDNDGILLATTPLNDNKHPVITLKNGEHISEFKHFKNTERYFESCKKFKKTFSIKLVEEFENELGKRIDLIFSPFLKNNDLVGVFLISQEVISHDKEKIHLSVQKKLEDQRNYALNQIDEIEAQKSELELAFKKSSKHHIMLQKALRQIETQKSELEKALEIINKQKGELEKANKEIKESSRLKELFLANTSHEIRTPLNAIIGFTNLLFNTNLDLTQTKYLDNIRASGNNLLVVIKDILDFSKIESGKLTLEQIEFDFKNLIVHTINTLSVKSKEKNIAIQYDISEDMPKIVKGDPVRLNQILINLLGNAIKFTKKNGKIRLLATLGQPVNDKIKLLFKIEDNGIGIPKDKLNFIFQSFTQGESDTTRKYGGTGLGLSIVKQLIELQDGEISVDSEVNLGTSFTFYILLKEGSSKKLSMKPVEKNLPECNSAVSYILLVEDNIINQQLAYDTIKTWNKNITIEVAENGLIALQKVKENDYDLILMDIQMPEMDGNEATIEIRKLPEPKSKIPIIAMTAHALKNEKESSLSKGMDDYITKPFDPDELFNKILKHCPKKGEILTTKLIEEEPTLVADIKEEIKFEYFNLKTLEKIYGNNIDKIIKIVSMCYKSIPQEIAEIEKVLSDKNYMAVKNKAHSLKPKLGYLGMLTMQENAKNIELLTAKEKPFSEIRDLLFEIDDYWEKASKEIKILIDQN